MLNDGLVIEGLPGGVGDVCRAERGRGGVLLQNVLAGDIARGGFADERVEREWGGEDVGEEEEGGEKPEQHDGWVDAAARIRAGGEEGGGVEECDERRRSWLRVRWGVWDSMGGKR